MMALKPKVISPASGQPAHSREAIAQVRALWDAGLSVSEIGRRLGVTKGVISGIKDRNDFDPRRRKG